MKKKPDIIKIPNTFTYTEPHESDENVTVYIKKEHYDDAIDALKVVANLKGYGKERDANKAYKEMFPETHKSITRAASKIKLILGRHSILEDTYE